ncbi:MAG: hypothetical protein Q4D41_10510 [Prevotellaceae bacterium]|nr:hypothetical protein [Prevotellaceae bacterium]
MQIHLEEDLNKLMPSSKNEDGTTKLAFADLRIKDKVFILFEGKKGVPVERISETCDAFIDSLEAMESQRDSDNHVIGDIFYQIPEDIIPDAIDYMSAHLPSYIDTSAYQYIDSLLTYKSMKKQMQVNKSDLQGSFGSMFPELIQMDPIGLRSVLKEQFNPLSGSGGNYKIVDGHFFVKDSTVCVAFLTPEYSSTNTGQGSALFNILNENINNFEHEVPDVKISYHGTPASGYYNSWRIKSDLTETISWSLVIVLLFIFYCFRNYNTVPLLLLPVVFGVLFGLSAMYFIKGQFSLLALGIGAVVLGVAFSYVLHIITHFKYVNDPEQVLQDEVKPVCLGCITTVGSFIGLIFIRMDLLKDFGLFATFVIIGTTIFSIIFLPLLFNPAKNKINNRAFKIIDRINSYPIDRNKPVLFLIFVVTIVCIGSYLVNGIHFDADMHNLGYKEKRTTYSEELLRSKTHTGDKQKYFASSGATMEEAIEHFDELSIKLDSLQRLGIVKSYTHTNEILIPLKVQKQRIEAWNRYWNKERLDKVRSLIRKTAPEEGLNPEAFEPFFDIVSADYKPDALYKANIIPEGYLSTLMEQSYNGDYLCFTSVVCKNDSIRGNDSDYNRICDAISSSPDLLVLDTYYYTRDTLEQMNKDFNVLQWVSMLFVLIVLFFSFHFNIKYTLLGFMPILLSWLIVLGTMAIFGVQFNLINIIISTFIFGIGVDYSIFVMNGLINGNSKPSLLEYHKTAIFFSAVILIITVSSMLFAKHPAILSVGFSTLVGLVSSVVISYVLQPAIFRLMNKDNKQ